MPSAVLTTICAMFSSRVLVSSSVPRKYPMRPIRPGNLIRFPPRRNIPDKIYVIPRFRRGRCNHITLVVILTALIDKPDYVYIRDSDVAFLIGIRGYSSKVGLFVRES